MFQRIKIMAAFAMLLSLVSSKAQPLADYLSAPFPSQLVAAPDGRSIAWVFNKEGERNIFYAAAPGFAARQLTQYRGDEGVDISQLKFTRDGSKLIYLRGNGSNSNGEPANPAQLQTSTGRSLWQIPVSGGAPVELCKGGSGYSLSPDGGALAYVQGDRVMVLPLLPKHGGPKPLLSARGGLGSLRWSPDGKYLAFTSNRTDHGLLGIFRLADSSLHYPDAGLDMDDYPAWSPDGKSLAYLRIPNIDAWLPFTPMQRNNPWSIRVLDLASMKAREVFRADTGWGSVFVDDIPAIDERLWWSGDDALVFPWEKNGWMQLYALKLSNGAVKHLTPGEGEVEQVMAHPQHKGLFVTTNLNDLDHRAIWRLDFADMTFRRLSAESTISWSPAPLAQGMAMLQSTGTSPAWPMLQEETKQVKKLAPEQFPARFPKDLIAPQAVTLLDSVGFKSYAQVILPKNYDPGKKYPAVIFLHGGSRRQMLLGFNYGSYYHNAYALQQYFAAQGYIALTLNYRSGIGYGLAFREADAYGAAGASEVGDLMAAADYLASRNDVDAKAIMPWGGSYGGYLTAHALTRAPGRFPAGVDIHGVHNWNNDIPVFAPWYIPERYPALAAKAFSSSPMAAVHRWRDPVLLIHGDDDRNVLFSETVTLAEKLRRQGVYLEQLVLPDEVHGFLLHRSWLKVYEATFDFLQRRGKPR